LPQSVIKEMTQRGLQDVKRRVHARRQDDRQPSWMKPGAGEEASSSSAAAPPPPQSPPQGRQAKATKYPGFSSSPPRPPTPQPKQPVAKPGNIGDDEGQFMGSVRVISPPPASFQATTMGGRNGVGGVGRVRPQGLGREGITPVQRLAKPFKPLTV